MDLHKELNRLLVDTFHTILKIEESALTRSYGAELSIGEFHLIEAIAKDTGAAKTVSSIAAMIGISVPSVTVALQKLEKKGYIERIKSEKDQRNIEVILTDKGNEIKHYHQTFHDFMIDHIINSLKESEQEILLKAISKLNVYFNRLLCAKGDE